MRDKLIFNNEQNALEKIEKRIDYVKSKMIIKNQLCQFKEDVKFLVVEGKRDKEFFEHLIINKNNDSIINISQILETWDTIKQRSKIFVNNETYITNKKKPNNKIVILQTFNVFNNISLEKNCLYAVVDKDFDNEYPSSPLHRVYSDNVHDLECTLLNSDNTLIGKIVKNEDKLPIINFMVYQLGLVKECIATSVESKNRPSISIDNYLNYQEFYDNEVLNVSKFIEFINTRSRQEFDKKTNNENRSKLKYLDKNEIIATLKKRKKLDNSGEWKIKKEELKKDLPEDFWKIINGHDYLNILKMVYKENMLLINIADSFEKFIVNNYDYKQFSKTSLFKKLKNVGILE